MWIIFSPLKLVRLEKICYNPINWVIFNLKMLNSWSLRTNRDYQQELLGRNIFSKNGWEKRGLKLGLWQGWKFIQAQPENISMVLDQNNYLAHRSVGVVWIVQEEEKDSQDEKDFMFSQQKDFDSTVLGGSKRDTKWRNQIAWKQYVDYCGKLKWVCRDS